MFCRGTSANVKSIMMIWCTCTLAIGFRLIPGGLVVLQSSFSDEGDFRVEEHLE